MLNWTIASLFWISFVSAFQDTAPLHLNFPSTLNYLESGADLLDCSPSPLLVLQHSAVCLSLFTQQPLSTEQAHTSVIPYLARPLSLVQDLSSGLHKCGYEAPVKELSSLDELADMQEPLFIAVKKVSSPEEALDWNRAFTKKWTRGLVFETQLSTQKKLEKRGLPLNLTQIPYSKRPIFQKYIFFNTATFLGLLTMFILVLILVLGIQTLAGIQSPTRFEAKPKQS